MGKSNAFALAAGECTHFCRRIGNVQFCKHRACIGLDLPTAVYLKLMLEFGHAFEQSGIMDSACNVMTSGFVITDGAHNAFARGKDRLKHGQFFVVCWILRKIGECFAFCTGYAANVGHFEAGNDPQKRRFAGTVRTDDADLVSVFETDGYILKKSSKTVIL